jgi:hypothetical protein
LPRSALQKPWFIERVQKLFVPLQTRRASPGAFLVPASFNPPILPESRQPGALKNLLVLDRGPSYLISSICHQPETPPRVASSNLLI